MNTKPCLLTTPQVRDRKYLLVTKMFGDFHNIYVFV